MKTIHSIFVLGRTDVADELRLGEETLVRLEDDQWYRVK